MKENFGENLNNEHTEGELSPAAELEVQNFETYSMPETINVNGAEYDAKLLGSISESLRPFFENNPEVTDEALEQMAAIRIEKELMDMQASKELPSEIQLSSKEAALANAVYAAGLNEAVEEAEREQAADAQQIVADTEGKRGLLERLTPWQKKIAATLAMVSGFGATTLPAAAQGFDWGRAGQAGAEVAIETVRRNAQVILESERRRSEIDIHGDRRHDQIGSRDIERRGREGVDISSRSREIASRQGFERQRFITENEARVKEMQIRGVPEREIRLHQLRAETQLAQMDLRHQHEREMFEIQTGRQVAHGEIGSSREHRDTEINRGYGHAERRNQEAVRREQGRIDTGTVISREIARQIGEVFRR